MRYPPQVRPAAKAAESTNAAAAAKEIKRATVTSFRLCRRRRSRLHGPAPDARENGAETTSAILSSIAALTGGVFDLMMHEP
jgi:hypothetical protein